MKNNYPNQNSLSIHLRAAIIFMACLLLASPAAFAQRDWNNLENWVYQLSDYTNNKLDEIAESDFDLAVVDLARDGSDDYFARSEIEAVKKTGKFILAYFEIGAIEFYRPEYNNVPDDLTARYVKGWTNEKYVKFWDERWWPIVKGRLDQALRAGFDGAYLDMITTYEEIAETEIQKEDLANKMVDLIVKISKYAKDKNPNFKIVPQNSPELYTWSYWQAKPNTKYINAIDGLGIESVFYLPHDKPANKEWCKENRQNALAIKKAGKIVLAVDYCSSDECKTLAYEKERTIGFIPYVSILDLNTIVNEGQAN